MLLQYASSFLSNFDKKFIDSFETYLKCDINKPKTSFDIKLSQVIMTEDNYPRRCPSKVVLLVSNLAISTKRDQNMIKCIGCCFLNPYQPHIHVTKLDH